jgi:putative transposase
MIKATKYRIYPTKKQRDQFAQHFGCARFVYNWGLERKIESYQKTGKSPSCFDLIKEMVAVLKVENMWLTEVNSQSLQMALRNLDNAFTSFFKKRGKFPKFKSKKSRQSFQCPQSVTVDFTKKKLNIPKIKGIKVKVDREFVGKIKTTTISRTPTGKYFASILVDDGLDLPEKNSPKKNDSVGVDLGIKDFAVLSTGEKIANPKNLIKDEKKLAKKSRQLSKKKKGSANRRKARVKLALLHEKVANKRKDFLHKLSKRLISENQAVCLEDLAVANMLKNHRLARHISDTGWGMFRSFCEYKADWYGKTTLVIGRFCPSSKLCDKCGTVNKDLKLKDRVWTCSCGTTHDRDILAARNILNFAFIPSV